MLRAACADAGIEPSQVDYVETHGTGTLLGDPIEARALGAVYGRGRSPQAPLLAGAVKTNFGHLEAAAGMVGLIKATLAVQSGDPGQPALRYAQPAHTLRRTSSQGGGRADEWRTPGIRRRAGVSSFGFGGTNAHVVIEQAPEPEPPPLAPTPAVTTLVLTGKNPERMGELATTVADWMDGAGLRFRWPISRTLNHHRTHHPTFRNGLRGRPRAGRGRSARARSGQPATRVVGPQRPGGPGTASSTPVRVRNGRDGLPAVRR